jgi:hypothetical protein
MPSAELVLALGRQAALQLLKALLGWLGVFVLVAVISGVRFRFSDVAYPVTVGWLRFARLLAICLPFFPVLVLLILGLHGWTPDPVGSIRWSIRCGAIVFGIAPAIFGLLAVQALLDRGDPWRYLPGGPPVDLVEFARKHPHLRVRDWGYGYALYDAASNRVTFAVGELEGATLTWEKWVDEPDLIRLDGPPPLPRSSCILRIVILRPDYAAITDEEADQGVEPPNRRTVKYVYRVPWVGTQEVEKHFKDWAESKGGRRDLGDIESGGKKWWINMIVRRYTVHQIEISYTEPPEES